MDTCPICRGAYEEYSVVLECDHSYHLSCIEQWENKGCGACPVCGDDISIRGQYYPRTLSVPDDHTISKAITPWVWKVLVRHSNTQHTPLGGTATIEQDYLLQQVTDLVKEERPWIIRKTPLTISHVLFVCTREYLCQVRTSTVEYTMH